MADALFLFVAVFFMFRIVFTATWKARFWFKVVIYFTGLPFVAAAWILSSRYLINLFGV